MLHEPSTPVGKDPAGPYKTRLGVWMFTIYALFYTAFVVINLTAPQTMGLIVFAGMNLATVIGFVLIVGALIEALIYDALCHRKETEMDGPSASNDGPTSTKGRA